jgi:hypothetical protein
MQQTHSKEQKFFGSFSLLSGSLAHFSLEVSDT